MTQHPAAGTSSHGTGDINLASALMALGIAPDSASPCSIVSRDDGRDYGRFFIGAVSDCGKFETLKLMGYWSDPQQAPSNHPFAWLLSFISGRPPGCSSVNDWLDYAHDHLAALGELPAGMPRNIHDIPPMTAKAPEARASYVLAFVHCRSLCLHLVRVARREVMLSKGGAHSIIDSRLPRAIRNNLIARLDG